LKVEWISDSIQFAAMRPEWSELLACSNAGVFCSWEWLYPWFWRLGSGRQLELLAARDESGQLIGLMPLCLERRTFFGRALRRLSFLGDERVGSEYLDVIARSGCEQWIAAEFAAAIRDRPDWDLLDLRDLREGSATLASFREALASNDFKVRVYDRCVCPYEEFRSREGFDAFLRRTARRDNYLRRRRWLEAQPGFQVDREGDPARLSLPLAELFRLHSLRWAGDSDGIAGSDVEGFHREAAVLLAECGRIRLYTLKVAGRALASVYAIVHRSKFIFYQSGFDPGWANRSVGLVLLAETFRDCIESGFGEYDFLRGTEPYKLDWTSLRRRTVALRAFRKGGIGEWLERRERASAVLRGLAKDLLPERWVEGLRSWRRRRARSG
jgi:CelD/BcsL family acetyltransferase involved in cellulose biosynthesis